jgi:hypothetical protein
MSSHWDDAIFTEGVKEARARMATTDVKKLSLV